MTSPTWWTWVWASSGSWWWTRRPGVLQSMGLQRVGHNWVTELNLPILALLLEQKFYRQFCLVENFEGLGKYVQMWELDRKEYWAPKNWCFWIEVLEKTLESPWDCTEIKPVNPKGNQSWIFTGRTDAEAEIPILGPPDVKSQLIWKDLDAGKDGGQEEKGATEDEMIGWHYIHNGHEFEQTPGDSEGQGSLACCSPWGCKSQTWLSDCTTTKGKYSLKFVFKRWVTFKKWDSDPFILFVLSIIWLNDYCPKNWRRAVSIILLNDFKPSLNPWWMNIPSSLTCVCIELTFTL